jgi:hypothetical protein
MPPSPATCCSPSMPPCRLLLLLLLPPGPAVCGRCAAAAVKLPVPKQLRPAHVLPAAATLGRVSTAPADVGRALAPACFSR